MHCPNCGNSIITKGKFCSYCGTQIPEDVLIKIDSKEEILDHARIEEAKGSPMVTKEKEKTRRHRGRIAVFLVIILGFVFLAAMTLYNDNQRQTLIYRSPSTSSTTSAKKTTQETKSSSEISYTGIFAAEQQQHAKEVERLRKIEDEVLEDIRNERYEQALLKAQTLRYTDTWSKQTKEEWDKMREALIQELTELMNKEPGK